MARALIQRHRDTEVAKVPLWSVTYWDKHFTNVPKDCQPKVIKYHYYLAAELEPLVVTGGDVKILTTNITDLWTTTDKVQETLSEGEVVSIPWGGNPNIQYYNGKFVTSDNRIATSRDRSILDNRYLYFCMVGNRDVIASCYRGASLKHPEMAKVLNIEIPLPPLAEQKRIAGELDRICELKKNAEDRLALMDQLVKSKFVEMFGDVETNQYGFDVKRLDDVCASIIRGPFGSALKKEFFVPKSDRSYKVYEQKHAIQKNEKIGSYYISEDKFKELGRFECRPGDVIMSCSGTMGEFFQLPASCERGVMNQALCKFTLGDKVLSVYFLAFMSQAISQLQTQGSGIKNIAAVSYVKALKFILPPLSLQHRFAAFVESVDKSKAVLKETIATMETLYKERLQEYFA